MSEEEWSSVNAQVADLELEIISIVTTNFSRRTTLANHHATLDYILVVPEIQKRYTNTGNLFCKSSYHQRIT